MSANVRKILLTAILLSAATWKWLTLLEGWDASKTIAPAPSSREASRAVPTRSSVTAPRPKVDVARPVILPSSTGTTSGKTSGPLAEDASPLADELHAPAGTGGQDISIVMNLFSAYRTRYRGFPVGEDNAAFVHALTGHNPGKLAFLPRNHPAIDARGQLLDRWGQPFFFHLLSREALEIRSAGPDQKLYTADDLIAASPQAKDVGVALLQEN